MSRHRVLIVNTVALNTGDAALMLCLVDRVRAALGDDTELRVADSQPDASQNRYPELTFVPLLGSQYARRRAGRLQRVARAWHRAAIVLASLAARHGRTRLASVILPAAEAEGFEAYLWATSVVSAGGTMFVEHYPLADRFLTLGVAALLSRPYALFTQSLGPFRKPGNRLAMRQIVRNASLTLLRDATSRQHLEDIGAPLDRVLVTVDAAFGMDTDHAERRRDRRGALAISVRKWPYASAVQGFDSTNAYRQAIRAAVVEAVTARDLDVVFVSSCQGDENYWTDDSEEAEVIAGGLPEAVRARVTVDREFRTPAELTAILGEFAFVIATRMHVAIMAVIADTPVLPIAYEFKTRDVFGRLGLGDTVIAWEAVSAENLVSGLRRLASEEAMWRGTVAQPRQDAHAQALAAAGYLAEALAPAESVA